MPYLVTYLPGIDMHLPTNKTPNALLTYLPMLFIHLCQELVEIFKCSCGEGALSLAKFMP